jgi:hypothetical protein
VSILAAGPAGGQSLTGAARAETYAAHGAINGCGLSFHYTWIDGEVLLGVAGSMNYFVFDDGTRSPMIKIIAARNNISTLLKFAWFEVPGYGDTMKLERVSSGDPNAFSALAKRDPAGALMAPFAARDGFRIGIHFVAEPKARIVAVPPAPMKVQEALATCNRKLPQASD